MVLLVHHSISPQSRKVRLIMAEKKMLFVLKEEEPWKLSQDILDINPSGDLPVLVFDGKVVAGNYAVTEYLEESNPQYKLLPEEPLPGQKCAGLWIGLTQNFLTKSINILLQKKL